MKALVKAKPETGLWMEEVPIPEISENEVLIKVKKTGICGTDLHHYKWDEWSQSVVPVPLVIGHEFVGEIAEVGSNVKKYTVGQRVTAEGHVTCGKCRRCMAGQRHLCSAELGLGSQLPGAFAEYVKVPEENVFLLPDHISDDMAALFDPLGNAIHSTLEFNLVGEDVLITGAGPIGLMCIPIAKQVGARHVVITDLNEERLKLARTMGATHAVNPLTENLHDVMADLGMANGFDIGLEMSGSMHAFNDMLDVMFNGGKISLLGILPDGGGANWSKVIFKILTVKGIYGRKVFSTWYKTCCLLDAGLDVSKVITHHYKADDFQKGFDAMLEGSCGKVMLDWT